MMPLQNILDDGHPVRFLSFPRTSEVLLLNESVSGLDCNLRQSFQSFAILLVRSLLCEGHQRY